MNIHMKAETGYKEVIEQLKELTNDEIKIEDYRVFFDITIDTSLGGDYLSIFQEKHYGQGDYAITVWKKGNNDKQVYIPLKYIDCIFKL